MMGIAAYERHRRAQRTARRIAGITAIALLGLIIAIYVERRFDRCEGKMRCNPKMGWLPWLCET